MKRALTLIVLLLGITGCAPSVQTVVGTGVEVGSSVIDALDPARLVMKGADVEISNPGPGALTGDTSRPGDGVALTLDTTADYRPAPDANGHQPCEQIRKEPAQWSCDVGTIPEKQAYLLRTASGHVLNALGFGYRNGVPVGLRLTGR